MERLSVMMQDNSSPPIGADPLLSEVELADYLKCSSRTLKARRLRGQGPTSLRVGGLIRYRQSDVRAWLDNQAARPVAVATN